MKKQTAETPATFDGKTWETVQPAGNAVIDTAAEALDAVALAVAEWADAKQALDEAEAAMETQCADIVAGMKDDADRLRGEAARRRAEAESYNEEVFAKTEEVRHIHPALGGSYFALQQYARGCIGIAEPCDMPPSWRFEPEVTDANREAVASFEPVRRAAPDTSAITLPGDVAKAVRRLVDARERYATACQALADAVTIFADCGAALESEAATEAETIARAAAFQAERDNKS